jgi:hypothetical protein
MIKRKAVHLIGETSREIGILVLVFAPLDAFFQPLPPSIRFLTVAIGLALILIVGGIILEAED